MAVLTDKEKAFVQAYVANGGNGRKAAREAGYTAKYAHQEAWRLLKRPNVVDAILDETSRAFAEDVPAARAVLRDLMLKSTNDGVRFQSAKALLEHGGLQVAQRHEHFFKDERTDDEIKARIQSLSAELGVQVPETQH